MSKMRGRKYPNRYETARLDGEKVRYKEGGFHKTTGTPPGKPIPKSKWRAALSGRYGKKGEEQARLGLALMGKTKKEFLG
mgnify:CR=1 FL=1